MKRNAKLIRDHYLTAAIWTNELDENTIEDFDQDSKEVATVIIHKFLKEAADLLTEEWTDEQIGHDLWLTRGGHGAGFWDRNLPNGKELTDICDKMRFNGEVFEADGVVYINDTV